MRVHAFYHVPFEGLGSIAEWAAGHGHSLTETAFYADPTLPDLEQIDMLVVMGGPMSVNDTEVLPWLEDEARFVGAAIKAGKIVLGICLGSQLIAKALGASVYPNREREIGWFPLHATSDAIRSVLGSVWPVNCTVFHWHGETFDLPADAVLLASSEACTNQAFLYENRVLGLQFHFEMTPSSIVAIYENGGDDLSHSGTYIQKQRSLESEELHLESNRSALFLILDRLTALR